MYFFTAAITVVQNEISSPSPQAKFIKRGHNPLFLGTAVSSVSLAAVTVTTNMFKPQSDDCSEKVTNAV